MVHNREHFREYEYKLKSRRQNEDKILFEYQLKRSESIIGYYFKDHIINSLII